MKHENQALRLERLVQMHQRHPEYELCLPLFSVKKSALKKLQEGDLFLLGMAHLEFMLLSAQHGCARALPTAYGKGMTIEIVEALKKPEKTFDSKKYKNIRVSLGTLQSRVLETGHKIETSGIDMENISLYVDEKKIAEARCVMVDEEIALQITEVKR